MRGYEEVENPMINFKEEEPEIVTHCTNCHHALTECDELLDFDGEHFCDVDCLFNYYGISLKEGWEVK